MLHVDVTPGGTWLGRSGRKKQYYYRKIRQGRRVISVYLGRDDAAALIAQLDESERKKREGKQSAERQMRAELAALDQEVGKLEEFIRLLLKGVFLANGYHKHQGQWRAKRHRQ